jgi:hypothetical protein
MLRLLRAITSWRRRRSALLCDSTRAGPPHGFTARMGHDDMRAALIYQRAAQEAAERIARGLSDLADRHRAQGKDNDPDEGRHREPGSHGLRARRGHD